MAKRLPIRPVISKIRSKNVYDYRVPKTQIVIMCSGFELDISDSESGTRIKRVVRASYQTAKELYLDLKSQLSEGDSDLPTLISQSENRTLEDLFRAFENAKSEPSLRNRRTVTIDHKTHQSRRDGPSRRFRDTHRDQKDYGGEDRTIH